MTVIAAPTARHLKLIGSVECEPRSALLFLLSFHVVVWTVLPAFVCANLQLDLVEGLALGKEWQLGYWKHPPLPWWITDAIFQLTGDVRSVYLLGPLSTAVCLYAVWRLAVLVTSEVNALIAVASLEGIHFYNFSAVKFAHDQLQLPFWALTGLFFYRALTRQRLLDWALTGVFLALAFWSKYAAFALAASLGLFAVLDPEARRSLRTPGPWLMICMFLVVIAPNIWWLATHDFLPFQYVDARAARAASWLQQLLAPILWTGSQLLYILPALALLAIVARRPAGTERPPIIGDSEAFARRIVTVLALGPFLITFVVALALGRRPIAMWGYPLWSFLPLAILLWVGSTDLRRRQQFILGIVAVLFIFPAAYVFSELVEPFLRHRHKATNFPGAAMAEAITLEWQQRFGTPLAYVAGTEFAVNNLAVYSADKPHVIVHGQPRLSPWIKLSDVAERGLVLIAEDDSDAEFLESWRNTFGPLELDEVLLLPRQTKARIAPVKIKYTFIPPKP